MRIGILGAGHIAGKVSGTLKQMKEVRCHAVAARDLWRAQAFAGEHGFEKAYGSYEELCCDPDNPGAEFCLAKKEVRTFLKKLIAEFAGLFPESKIIHLGETKRKRSTGKSVPSAGNC